MKISSVSIYPGKVSYLTPKTAAGEETREVQKLSNEIALINKETIFIKDNKLDFSSLSNVNRVKLLDSY
ncbi:MAG: hypothetical protein HYV97_09810 [Bdellovibrio sp.]|nr:hypothetical protein [Bdellovibrio sp.]